MKVYEIMAALGEMPGNAKVKVSHCMTLAEIVSREDTNLTGEGDKALFDCGGIACDVYSGAGENIVYIEVET